ncbi:hypothetical protein CPC16_003603 [Podila verticillata]|nr:hypothetical protein BGZ52_001427 [Haplosporangium bisporale]KAF9217917.1 hypothetical protein BGZ59_008045 [Podila verticillata]KAF9396258.1 hypothetical protein CPC16_003603 [Podila verticillata]KFH67159.1 hypothetical protein MVEG_07682 [Podila verticillata NRRL 6337]
MTSPTPPKVLIVGAGLGGLCLGILLEHAGISYEIYEQCSIFKPIGSAISLTAGVLAMMRQIGIYEDVLRNSKVATSTKLYNDKRQEYTSIDWSFAKDITGYDSFIIARPVLYSMLLRQIPLHKIHMGKKVLGLQQNESGVTLFCSDNRSYFGDLLIGADGASSIVRTNMYSQMKSRNILPPADEAEMRYTCECLVGQTKALDSRLFPELKKEACILNTIVGYDGPYKWATLTTGHSICWMVFHFFNDKEAKEKNRSKDLKSHSSSNLSSSSGSSQSYSSQKYSEWGPEATEVMCNSVRDFAVPGGNGKLTVGDLIDNTSKDFIAKGMLAERVFETWSFGRIVLLGDACHPMDPYGGQGAVNAMQDAIALANWINVLPSGSQKDVEAIYEEYKAERLPAARKSFQATRLISLTNERGMAGTCSRFVAKKTPVWLRRYMVRKISVVRPQVSFLPYVPDQGEVAAVEQLSYTKTKQLAEQKEERKKY